MYSVAVVTVNFFNTSFVLIKIQISNFTMESKSVFIAKK